MSQAEKAAIWTELKNAGVQFERHYREYTTETLRQARDTLRERLGQVAEPEPSPPAPEPVPMPAVTAPRNPPPREQPGFLLPETPVNRTKAPDTMAGIRQNTRDDDEPIRVDDDGLIWYQDEIRKPAYPKPRGRRVLKYNDPGTKEVTVKSGMYTETFEVAGDENRLSEVKITLPAYQVGIYKDPRYPFKIHVYNDKRGFDLADVQAFYGAPDLVPTEIKRDYVSNDLVYDIRTTIRAITSEYRENVLKQGKTRA